MKKIILFLLISCISPFFLFAQAEIDESDKQLYSAGAADLPDFPGFNISIYQSYWTKKHYAEISLGYDGNAINTEGELFISLALNKRKQKLVFTNYKSYWTAKIPISEKYIKKRANYTLSIGQKSKKVNTLNFSFHLNTERYISLLTPDSVYILLRQKDTLGISAMSFLRENRSKNPILIDTASHINGFSKIIPIGHCYLSYQIVKNETDKRFFTCGDSLPKFFVLPPKAKHEMLLFINTCNSTCKNFVSIVVSFFYSKTIPNIRINDIKDVLDKKIVGFGVSASQ